MNRRLVYILGCVLCLLALSGALSLQACAEEKPMVPVREDAVANENELSGRVLSGNVRIDLFGLESLAPTPAQAMQQSAVQTGPRKSPWIAAGLSVLVPGAGEFYTESYWRSAAFLAIEVATWALAYSFDKKGDRQTDTYQAFANAHWDVTRYAQWTLANAGTINSSVDIAPYLDPTNGVIVNGRVNWTRLNQLESALGNWFSHNLPTYGDQQYYELIGKYPQFNQGWDDAKQELPGDYDVVKANLTPRYLYYSGERGKANDFYDKATTFVTVAIVNHVVSAIDAAWSASSYNRVHAEVGMQRVPVGAFYADVPVVKVRYGF